MAIKIQVKKNFFYVTNTFDNHTKRSPLKETSYEITSDNENVIIITQNGIRQSAQTYRIDNLIDENDLPFPSVNALDDFLSSNLYM